MKRFALGLATGLGAALVAIAALAGAAGRFRSRGASSSSPADRAGLGWSWPACSSTKGRGSCCSRATWRARARARGARSARPRRGDDAALRRAAPRRRPRRRSTRCSTRWRTVDVLINNAGVIQVGPLEHMDHEDFENAMATHFWGPLHADPRGDAGHAAPPLRAHRQHLVDRRQDCRAAPRAVLGQQVRAHRPVRRACAPNSIRTASA